MVTEVTTQSWGSRIMDSLKNIVFGFVIFGLGIWLLWWNEHRAVRDYREVNEVRNNVVSVSSAAVSPAHEGAVVHVTGESDTSEVLTDPLFEVEVNEIRLRRTVEMYQWKETIETHTKKKTGGSTETTKTPSYQRVWSDSLIRSGNFMDPEGHQNPGNMHPEGYTDYAKKVTLGSFTLSPDALNQLNSYEALTVHSATLPEGASLEDSVIYYGNDRSNPQIGDRRVTFQVVPKGMISIIAEQDGSELNPWRSRQGRGYIRVQTGKHSAEEMLDQAESEIRMMTWLLRAGGWLLMSFGMITVFTPLAVLGDVLPFLGNLIGGGIRFFSFIICLVLALVIIGIAWVAARPLIGVPLLLAAVGLLGWMFVRARKKREQAKEPVPVS